MQTRYWKKMHLNTPLWNSVTHHSGLAGILLVVQLPGMTVGLPGSAQLTPLPRKTVSFCPTFLTPHLEWSCPSLYSGLFFFLASSKPSRKVQDHYNRQKCSEIAHHCQLITKKSFNSWHYYKLYTHYDRDNWALCFSCPALEPQTMPSCCWEWPGCTWKQVGSLHGLPMLTTAACGPLGTPCSWVGVR